MWVRIRIEYNSKTFLKIEIIKLFRDNKIINFYLHCVVFLT